MYNYMARHTQNTGQTNFTSVVPAQAEAVSDVRSPGQPSFVREVRVMQPRANGLYEYMKEKGEEVAGEYAYVIYKSNILH